MVSLGLHFGLTRLYFLFLYAGSIQKLIEIYGKEYTDYKKHIPTLFPEITKAAK
jgi:protein-S-isoprenylcysteine O-methyltransferase Ste14